MEENVQTSQFCGQEKVLRGAVSEQASGGREDGWVCVLQEGKRKVIVVVDRVGVDGGESKGLGR